MITLLIDPDAFDGAEWIVEGEPYRHLFRARRMEVGAQVRVVDGRGRARHSVVVRIDRSTATLAMGEEAPANEPTLLLDLFAPTLRPERAAWMVEKATELGVSAIHFFNSERAPRSFEKNAIERLRRVAIAALEQCHRARLPKIDGPFEFGDLEPHVRALDRTWLLDPRAEEGAWPSDGTEARAGLLLGPEGGLTEAEIDLAKTWGATPVALGGRILRIETAVLVGAARALAGRG